jgi:hypothetical protein
MEQECQWLSAKIPSILDGCHFSLDHPPLGLSYDLDGFYRLWRSFHYFRFAFDAHQWILSIENSTRPWSKFIAKNLRFTFLLAVTINGIVAKAPELLPKQNPSGWHYKVLSFSLILHVVIHVSVHHGSY